MCLLPSKPVEFAVVGVGSGTVTQASNSRSYIIA